MACRSAPVGQVLAFLLPHREIKGPAPSHPASGWKAEVRASGSDTQAALSLLAAAQGQAHSAPSGRNGAPARGSSSAPSALPRTASAAAAGPPPPAPHLRPSLRRKERWGEAATGLGQPLLRPLALASPRPHEDPKPVYGFIITPHCAPLAPCYLNTNKR